MFLGPVFSGIVVTAVVTSAKLSYIEPS